MPEFQQAAARAAGVVRSLPRGSHWLLACDNDADGLSAAAAVALALALCGEPALAWGPTGLAGAVGDWQHMGGWQGWNLEVLQRCRAAGHILQVPMPPLIGLGLAEALTERGMRVPGVADA